MSMMVMGSPMEALAINYLTHTVLNIWTWIAFLTAALSFWKIKACIHSDSPSPSPPPQPSPPQPRQISAKPDLDQEERPSTTKSFTSSTTFCSLENKRIGKFRVYYGEDDKDDSIVIGRSQRRMMAGSVRRNPEKEERLVRQVDGWEALLKLKTAEMGWYHYQDLTVLNGSVVQLWNHSNHHVVF